MVIRILNVLVFCAILWAVTASQAMAQDTVRLRHSVTVETSYVTLGDLFNGLNDPALADKTVAYAPQPGRRVTLDYRWLTAIAQRERLDWRPRSRRDAVLIERASLIIEADDIETELNAALDQQGIDGPRDVQLANQNFQLHLATDMAPIVKVRQISINQRTRRFSATIVTGADTDQERRYKVSGTYFPVVEVPVTTRAIARGEVIEEGDVQYQSVRAARVKAQAIRDLTDVIGKAAQRTLQAETILTRRDVRIPILVKRNAIVNMILQTPTLNITTQGRALENGGMDETVRVMNTDSRKTIEARVSGVNEVTVDGGGF